MCKCSLHILTLCLIGLLAIGCTPPSDGPAVAQVQDTPILLSTFKTQYTQYLLHTGLADQPRLRYAFLDRVTRHQLLVLEARQQGIEHHADYKAEREQIYRKLLLEAYTKSALYDSITVGQRELEDMFVRVNTTLTARHLYSRTLEGAELLHERLRQGTSFESLAQEVFADPTLAANGGSLGTFGYDEMDPSFEDAAYQLQVGEISEPVRTAQGYSIIQLEDRFTPPLLTETAFAQKKDQMERYVRSRKQRLARTRHTATLVDEMEIQLDASTLQQLHALRTGQQVLSSSEEQNQFLLLPLASFIRDRATHVWTVRDFQKSLAFTSQRQHDRIRTITDLSTFIKGLLVQEEMVYLASSLGLDKTNTFERALLFEMDKWVFDYAQQQLSEQITISDEEATRYYTSNLGSFTAPPRRRVHEIMLGSHAEALTVANKLQHMTFQEAAREFSQSVDTRNRGGDLGFVTESQLGVVAASIFNAKEGTVVGPLAVGDAYFLFLAGSSRPEKPATFEEAYPQIEALLKEQQLEALQETHTDSLMTVFRVSRNTDLLEQPLLNASASS